MVPPTPFRTMMPSCRSLLAMPVSSLHQERDWSSTQKRKQTSAANCAQRNCLAMAVSRTGQCGQTLLTCAAAASSSDLGIASSQQLGASANRASEDCTPAARLLVRCSRAGQELHVGAQPVMQAQEAAVLQQPHSFRSACTGCMLMSCQQHLAAVVPSRAEQPVEALAEATSQGFMTS